MIYRVKCEIDVEAGRVCRTFLRAQPTLYNSLQVACFTRLSTSHSSTVRHCPASGSCQLLAAKTRASDGCGTWSKRSGKRRKYASKRYSINACKSPVVAAKEYAWICAERYLRRGVRDGVVVDIAGMLKPVTTYGYRL